jgi:hypothetical protein
MVGSSFAIAHISKFIRAKSIVFGEDGIDASRWFWRITRPFADYIVIPDAIPDDFGPNQIKHSSYHELAYLHPNRFSPDKGILEQVGLAPHESFSLVRFVSFGASHDLGESGFYPQLRDRLIKILEAKGRVILNAEGSLPRELEKYRMKIPPNKLHDLISFAKLLVSDSQTMTIEAAALGVPSVRYNSFVGKTPVIEEIESRYQLTYGFRPAQQEEMLEKVKDILGRQDPAIWHDRRQLMLTEKKDLTSWMVKFVETIGKE